MSETNDYEENEQTLFDTIQRIDNLIINDDIVKVSCSNYEGRVKENEEKDNNEELMNIINESSENDYKADEILSSNITGEIMEYLDNVKIDEKKVDVNNNKTTEELHKDYGFILTRHVNSEKTNKYWNQCVKLLRANYPMKRIIIIDDNSNKDYIKADFDYKNITVVESQFPKRGELLPYIYYAQYGDRWFKNAVIIHDSLFIHKRFPFEAIKLPVMPLWHAKYDKENLQNILRIANTLKNKSGLMKSILGTEINILGMNKDNMNLCFGCQSYINLNFLKKINEKYRLGNMIPAITCRTDRCSLERIMGLIFCLECPSVIKRPSLNGLIFNHYKSFNYYFEEYMNDFNNKKIVGVLVKIWTGR